MVPLRNSVSTKDLKTPKGRSNFPKEVARWLQSEPCRTAGIWFGDLNQLYTSRSMLTIFSASHDILRLYDLKEQQSFKHSTVPFLIVPGPPRAGVISALHIDPTCKYMLSAAGTRGWEGSSTEVLIGYEIGIPSWEFALTERLQISRDLSHLAGLVVSQPVTKKSYLLFPYR